MITTNFVLGVIMLVSSIFAVGIFLYLTFTKSEWFIIAVIISAFALFIPGLATVLDTPTKADVLEGNAHYVRELNVEPNSNGEQDTTVTYRLEYNKK